MLYRAVHVGCCPLICLLNNESFTDTYVVMVLVQISIRCLVRFPHLKRKEATLAML